MVLKVRIVVILSRGTEGASGVLVMFSVFIWVLVSRVCLDYENSLKCIFNDLCIFLRYISGRS